MKKIIIVSLILSSQLIPFVAMADVSTDLPPITTVDSAPGVLKGIQTITNWVFSIFIAIAVLMIIIGAFQYLTAGGSSEKTGSAKKMLFYAIIAVVIAVSAQSIVILSARLIGADVSKQFQTTPPPPAGGTGGSAGRGGSIMINPNDP